MGGGCATGPFYRFAPDLEGGAFLVDHWLMPAVSSGQALTRVAKALRAWTWIGCLVYARLACWRTCAVTSTTSGFRPNSEIAREALDRVRKL